jgi:OPT family oligopeptide transporter
MKLMSRYPEVSRELGNQYPSFPELTISSSSQIPLYWYGAVFLVNLALGIAAIHAWPTGMPVWALFLALAIAIILALPIGMIQAITNQQVGLNVITELIIGFAVPGKPVSMMIFKTYGYITMAQGMSFINDMKIGHYMKIPPRTMFWGQCSATAVAAITQIFVQAWVFDNIEGICDTASEIWWCPSTQTFGTASIIWVSTSNLVSFEQEHH